MKGATQGSVPIAENDLTSPKLAEAYVLVKKGPWKDTSHLFKQPDNEGLHCHSNLDLNSAEMPQMPCLNQGMHLNLCSLSSCLV